MFCEKCGAKLDDGARFCASCGAELKIDSDETVVLNKQEPEAPAQVDYSNQTSYQGQSQPMYHSAPNFNYQQQYQQPSKSKKGLKWWHILLIVLGSLLVLFLIIGIIANSSDNNDETDDKTASSYSSEKDVKYTKGEIKNDYYINEWADIKLEITDDFPDTPNLYSNYEDSRTDAGFVSANRLTGKQLIIAYEKTSSLVTETVYLESCKNTLDESFKGQAIEAEYSKISDKKIAGKQFKVLRYTVKSNDINGCICVRMIGNRAMVINMTSFDEDDFNTAFSLMSEFD